MKCTGFSIPVSAPPESPFDLASDGSLTPSSHWRTDTFPTPPALQITCTLFRSASSRSSNGIGSASGCLEEMYLRAANPSFSRTNDGEVLANYLSYSGRAWVRLRQWKCECAVPLGAVTKKSKPRSRARRPSLQRRSSGFWLCIATMNRDITLVGNIRGKRISNRKASSSDTSASLDGRQEVRSAQGNAAAHQRALP